MDIKLVPRINCKDTTSVKAILYGKDINIILMIEKVYVDIINKDYAPLSKVWIINYNEEKFPAFIKEIQKHPVTQKIIHIDFAKITTEKVIIPAQVRVINEEISVGLRDDGGVLNIPNKTVHIECDVHNIVSYIDCDIKSLHKGETISTDDIKIFGVRFIKNLPLVSIQSENS